MELAAQNSSQLKDLLLKNEYSLPKAGQVIEGEIVSAGKNSILVDLAIFGIGIVYPGEFYDNTHLQKSLKKGQRVSAILLELENEEGYRELSLKKAQVMTSWEYIKQKKESGEILVVKIENINKGGLIVEINGIQGFLPLSQLAPGHYPKVGSGNTSAIVQALQKFRGAEFQVKIIDFSETDNKLIVSEKAIYDDQLKEKIAGLKIGDTITGTVTDVTDFGAFVQVDLPAQAGLPAEPAAEKTETPEAAELDASGKVEGLIHVSEIDWKIVENPRDFLSVGQKIEAKIVNIEGTKISLSLKALKADPWAALTGEFAVGGKFEGEIVKLTSYGALVSLPQDIIGLVPIAEINAKKNSEPPKMGDKISVAVVSIEPKEHKMLLSLN